MHNTHLADNGMRETNFIHHKGMRDLSKVFAWGLIGIGLLSGTAVNGAPVLRPPAHNEARAPQRPVPVTKYLAYLKRSLEQRTQWVAGKPDTEALWARVRLSIENFLYREWVQGHLQGAKPVQAFRVYCDRTTMTQNDIEQGKVICVIGVAPLRPAEFELIRLVKQAAPSPQ